MSNPPGTITRPTEPAGIPAKGAATPAPDPAGPPAGASQTASDGMSDLRAFLFTLLEQQCRLVNAAAGAIYLAGSGTRPAGIVVTSLGRTPGPWRPEDLLGEPMLRRIERLSIDAVARGPRAVNEPVAEDVSLSTNALYDARATHRALAVPLLAEGRAEGACVTVIPITPALVTADAAARIALTGAQFEAFLWRQQCLTEAGQKTTLREALELLDAAQQGADAGSMAAILCHELQRRFGCTRVSIGLIQRDAVKLIALSGTEEIDRRAPAVVTLEAAMEECASQDIEILYPPPAETEGNPAERRVTRAHEELSRRFGPAAIATLPLRVEGDLAGVVLMERQASDPFPLAALPLLRLVAEFIGPAVYNRRLADRGVLAVSRDRVLELGQTIVGPRHTAAKLLALLLTLALLALALVPIPDRVRAQAEVRPAVARTIVPPFTGYLAKVLIKPGDAVKAGDVLAVMSDEELQLQLSKSVAQRSTLVAQRDDAQTRGEANKARVLSAQIDEADADIARTRQLLGWCTIRAPIDGVIARGDLDPFIGARIDPSQPIIEIAASRQKLIVRITERDAPRVVRGLGADSGAMEGEFVTKALPDRPVPVSLKRLNPAADLVETNNVYLGEAEFTDATAHDWLRPGMTGTVKIRDGWTTGLSAILRPVLDELRLKWWW